jgi:hypothetical protein
MGANRCSWAWLSAAWFWSMHLLFPALLWTITIRLLDADELRGVDRCVKGIHGSYFKYRTKYPIWSVVFADFLMTVQRFVTKVAWGCLNLQ